MVKMEYLALQESRDHWDPMAQLDHPATPAHL